MTGDLFSVERCKVGEAYPRNGNVHNPTPRYMWIPCVNGRAVGSEFTLRAAKSFLREYFGAEGAKIEVDR